ncbi:MAG TPA: hypothetical protein VM265_04095 [Sphingomicrobium sp.]|nr:hypothetical protein [Sphingomicrobium sp.]
MSTSGAGNPAPPRPPFVVSLGVTGHRNGALAGHESQLRERVETALRTIIAVAATVRERHASCFADEPTRLELVSPLAEGADQMVAEVAIALGFDLHALLPFGRDDYRASLDDDVSRRRFDSLLDQASCVLELPGAPGAELDAYVMTGRATVAHCDVLLALWDGLGPRGRGGTGEVVELALVNGTPVVHLPVDLIEPPRLLWSAFDPAVVTRHLEQTTERPFDEPHLELLLSATLAPPPDPQERSFLSTFFTERLRRYRTRIEYPLLLAAAGVARFDRSKIREEDCAAYIRAEWASYRRDCADGHQIQTPLERLEEAYSWSDRLATHFAQTYRSGHIFNFVLGGLAVCIGLTANIFTGAMLQLALLEGVITAGIIANTQIGVKQEWHRRWLDYRQLAERLRAIRSLKLLGVAAPDPPGSLTNPVPRRWIDWYAISLWRAMGCPAGRITQANAAELGRAVATFEIAPQVAYHERHSRQIQLLDRRLAKIAAGLFIITLIVSIGVVIGLRTAPELVNEYDPWLTLVEAGFPALGTAVFGIRFQADFGGSAVRSQATANALRQIGDQLAQGVSLGRGADLTEQAARIMLADLDEWRLINQQQDLDLA